MNHIVSVSRFTVFILFLCIEPGVSELSIHLFTLYLLINIPMYIVYYVLCFTILSSLHPFYSKSNSVDLSKTPISEKHYLVFIFSPITVLNKDG